MIVRALVVAVVLATFPGLAAAAETNAAHPKVIVLIGGKKSHGPYEHDFPDVVAEMDQELRDSPDVVAAGVQVRAFPAGWPEDPKALSDAATIVVYCDGLVVSPLVDPGRRQVFEQLMQSGVGLVMLHQASTVISSDRTIQLERWLGGARYGMVDRADETVALTPADSVISKGVNPFAYKDEFYPTVHLERSGVTPILTARLHDTDGATSAPIGVVTAPVAWSFERPTGGRAFGFTGLHYAQSLYNPDLRKLLFNAIFWTAGLAVPDQGVRSGPPAAPGVTRAADVQVVKQSWGELRWFTSAAQGNSATNTTGQATISVGQEAPPHYHPNCDEILRVVRGEVRETIGDKIYVLSAGDIVSIPKGIRHGSKNIGGEDAVLALSYSSAYRLTVGETP